MGLFDGTALERPVLCERCQQDVKICQCPPLVESPEEPSVAPEKQKLTIRVERRKRGKLATVISGLRGPTKDRDDLLTTLKNRCGSGGTLREGNIELQGDQSENCRNLLLEAGYQAKIR